MGLDTLDQIFPCITLYQFLTSEIKQIRDIQYTLLQTKCILILPPARLKSLCLVNSPYCLYTTTPTPSPIISIIYFSLNF